MGGLCPRPRRYQYIVEITERPFGFQMGFIHDKHVVLKVFQSLDARSPVTIGDELIELNGVGIDQLNPEYVHAMFRFGKLPFKATFCEQQDESLLSNLKSENYMSNEEIVNIQLVQTSQMS